jgi:hypothetical protein
MNDQGKKSSIQTLGAGLLGFVAIVGLGSLVILHHGGAAVKAPAAAYAPVDAYPGAAAPARAARPSLAAAPLGASGSAVSSPAPLLSDDARVSAGPAIANPAASGAAPNAPETSAAPKLVAGRHLDGSSSASSSASASSSEANPKSSRALARKPFAAPKLDLSKNQGTIASTVHYGVSSRAELMGRAAGPVYNFSGKGAGQQSGQVAADNAGPTTADALQRVDAAQKQIEASDASAEDKAKINKDLNQVRETAASGPAAR